MSFCIEINIASSVSRKETIYDNHDICIWSSDKKASFYSVNNYVCVCSGQITNGFELTSRFNLGDFSDIPKLVLQGYIKYGTDFFGHLDGQFAIGIIDTVSKKNLGVRDHFGNKNLYFQKTENGFILSDNLLNILSTIKQDINHLAIQNYFDFDYVNSMYSSETFYKGVFKVLPAHFVTSECNNISQHIFWKPSLDEYTHASPEQQAQLFKQKLIKSVKKNIDKNETVCSNLSGGLDSSSVSSITKMLGNEVNSLYFLTGHPSTDERVFANSVVQKWDLNHHEIKPEANQFEISKRIIDVCGLPDMLFLPGNSYFQIAKKARELNCTKIFTGDGGDSIVAYGNEYMEQLYEKEEWDKLKKSFENYVSKRDMSMYFTKWPFLTNKAKVSTYVNYFVGNRITTSIKKREIVKAIRNSFNAKRHLHFNFSYLLIKIFESIWIKIFRKNENLNLLQNKTVPQNYLKFELSSLPNSFTKFQKEHFGYSFTNLNMAVVEQQNVIMESMGVTAFHPFLDKGLIEVSVAVSSETRFAEGLGRGILRQSMAGILPEEVRLRTSKVAFSDYFLTYFENIWSFAKEEISPNHKVWKMIDKPTFDKLINQIFDNRIASHKKSRYIWLANRTIQLALWLNFFDKTQSQHIKSI